MTVKSTKNEEFWVSASYSVQPYECRAPIRVYPFIARPCLLIASALQKGNPASGVCINTRRLSAKEDTLSCVFSQFTISTTIGLTTPPLIKSKSLPGTKDLHDAEDDFTCPHKVHLEGKNPPPSFNQPATKQKADAPARSLLVAVAVAWSS